MPSTRELLSQEELDLLLSPLAQEGEDSGAAGEMDAEDGLDGEEEQDLASGEEGGAQEDVPPRERKKSCSAVKARVFAALFEQSLARLTGAYVSLELAETSEELCGPFMESLQSPAAFALLSARPMAGRVLFHCGPAMTLALADASLGAKSPCGQERPLTALDSVLIPRLLATLPACLTSAFDLPGPELRRLVYRGEEIRLTDPERTLLVTRFRFEVESARGQCLLAWEDRDQDEEETKE